MSNYLAPILLLIGSNVFMTFAWYGHLKYTDRPLWLVIVVSWGIAFFEYCLQVPANRYGYAVYNPAQLKAIQEIVTLCVFVAFSVLYLGAPVKWNQIAGFALAMAKKWGVIHVIWRQGFYPAQAAPSWTANYGNETANHMDHVHIATDGGGYPTGKETYFLDSMRS